MALSSSFDGALFLEETVAIVTIKKVEQTEY